MNRVYLVTGNHDISRQKGNSLSPFAYMENVIVIEDKSEIDIDGLKCLFLPYKYYYKEYEVIEGKYDYIFTHVMNEWCEFASEGVSYKNIIGTFIHGHDHVQKDRIDNFTNAHCILGVPYETRNREEQEHSILEIEGKNFKRVKTPFYFKHETLEYGQFPENKDNILNIINAPSIKAVYEKYDGYYIRGKGITLLRMDSTVEEHIKEFTNASLVERFGQFVKEFNVSKEVADFCSQKLINII